MWVLFLMSEVPLCPLAPSNDALWRSCPRMTEREGGMERESERERDKEREREKEGERERVRFKWRCP